jgi:hypothetical protein
LPARAAPIPQRDHEFESGSLQRGVSSEPSRLLSPAGAPLSGGDTVRGLYDALLNVTA